MALIEKIQFAIDNQAVLTILENGFIGINNTVTNATLTISGTLSVSDLITSYHITYPLTVQSLTY